MHILEIEVKTRRDDFSEYINKGRMQGLVQRYNLIDKTVSISDTNLTALEKMADLKTDALVVTDKDGMLKGVVEREQALSTFVITITKPFS